MANLRAEQQRKATGAFLQYALLRIESALVIAGTILAAVFLPELLLGLAAYRRHRLGRHRRLQHNGSRHVGEGAVATAA